ncbi:hypothetical protein Y1Q_0011830 [Alligator mississippiensis]|uniref:Uncharacterized protein n=1 Tax=Alligator mississippiensis TaxID=8496 RepID=A0A151LYK1_ALLMI|nr:hypothetical protein Y1Q_0011830 [Alligator mississippiensis]
MMMTGVKPLTREAVRFGHLTRQQGTPTPCFNQFISCFMKALFQTRNLLAYKHMNLSVDDCVRMGLREMQLYYKKSNEDDREEIAQIIWKRADWHRLFKSKTPKRDDNDKEEEDDEDSFKERVSNKDDREKRMTKTIWTKD